MPSTYSTSLGLELIGNGEQAGTWGTTTNTNLGTLLEQAIAGVQSITLTGNYTLTDFNGLPDEARNAVLVFGGLLAAPCNVIVPAVEKVYIVRNFSNATVTLKTSGGNGVAIANAASEVIFCDGTNIFSATQFNYIDGNLIVTGTATANNLVATNNVTLGKDLFGNSSTGQIYLPTGNTASRAATGTNGILRYNSELAIYEGYTGGTWVRFQTYPQGVYTINYLIISGGGAATDWYGFNGGAGGGGYAASSLSVTPGASYTMIIGAGGSAGQAGNPSSITGVGSSLGGGAGGGGNNIPVTGGAGGSGSSGGGGAAGVEGGPNGGGAAGIGTAGQGFNGGTGANFSGGGGGGGGAQGGNGSGDVGGAGGTGYLSTLTGSNVYYGGGGGGGAGQGSGGGGAGGGGTGGTTGGNGGTNTGGGGGGLAQSQGGLGGSGVIILQIPTVSYSGVTTGAPTVTISGSNTILKYTNSGTYTA